jgi:hypothetical protein
MVIIIILVLFVSISIYNWFTLLKSSGTLERIVYFSLTFISFVILILHSFDVKIPSPTNGIKFVIESFFESIKEY